MRTTFHSLLILVGVAGLACSGIAPEGGIYYASGEGSVTPDGLHLVKHEPFRISYVKPGADLQRYNKVLVQEVTVSYKTPPDPNKRSRATINPNYALPDSAIESLKRYFHDAFVKELGRSSKFSVADAPGPDVLLITGHIVNLHIQMPPERDQAVDETDFATSTGQMTLILDARDSTSGEPLVRVGQGRAIQNFDGGFYQSDPVSNSSAVREMFHRWASDLRLELDQFHRLPALPAVAAPTPPK